MSTIFQRVMVAVAILEIPLQIDTYLFYQQDNAEFGAIGGFNISLMTIALFVLYGAWMVEAASRPEPSSRRIIWGVPLFLYVVIVALSSVAAQDGMLTLFELSLIAQAWLLFFYLANRIESRSDLLFVVSLLAVCVASQSVLIIATSGMTGPRELSLGIIRAEIHKDGRPTGTLMSPVLAGSFLALLLIPSGSLLFARVSKPLKALSLLAVTTGALAIAITQTRGAIITMVVATAIFGTCMFLRGWLPKWAPAAAAFVVILIAVPLLNVFHQRIEAGDGGSAEARIHLSKIAMKLIAENPILGVGAGNCHLAMQKFATATPFRAEWNYTVHSKYLLVWVETGLLGFATFGASLLIALAQSWKTWKCSDPFLATLGLALFASILGHMIHMSVDMFNSRQQVQIVWACAGIAAGMVALRDAVAARETFVSTRPAPRVMSDAA